MCSAVSSVLGEVLEMVCPHGPSKAAKSSLEDSKLAAEHDSLFALASAVATAASAGRGAVGEFPWPFYFIGTRDCFSYNLVIESEVTASLEAQKSQ